MPDFSSLWENPLLLSTVVGSSRENKAEFSIKSQDKLELFPPVGLPYGPLIIASRTALDLFLTLKDGSTLNLRKAATQRLDALGPVIVNTGKVLEGAILNEFESDPAMMTEFFPDGRTELSQAKRGDMVGILNRFVDRATVHQAQLGAGWVTRLTTLRSQWTTNMATQSGATSQVESARSQIDMAWETLSWAFFDIAQQLAVDNPRHPEVADVFFDFSMFTRRTNAGTDNSGLIRVHVTTYSNTPIVDADIVIFDQNGQDLQSGKTDVNGMFESLGLPPGFYDVVAKQTGFLPRTMQYQVFDDNDPLHEIQLTAE